MFFKNGRNYHKACTVHFYNKSKENVQSGNSTLSYWQFKPLGRNALLSQR